MASLSQLTGFAMKLLTTALAASALLALAACGGETAGNEAAENQAATAGNEAGAATVNAAEGAKPEGDAATAAGNEAAPAAFPEIASIRTAGSSMRRTVAMSRGPSMTCPSRSKPTPMLPTLAGAKARATSMRQH